MFEQPFDFRDETLALHALIARLRGRDGGALWMAIAQCFAGGPETPPAPETRRTAAWPALT